MDELESWRAANILLKHFGGQAMLIAANWVQALLKQGDMDAASAWIGIIKAIAQLERQNAGKGDPVN